MTKSNKDVAKKQKQVTLKTCPACGSNWFGQVSIEQYRGAGDIAGQLHMRVLVCLCGSPLKPSGGSKAASSTAEYELRAFWESLAQAEAIIQECHTPEPVAEWAAAKLMREEQLAKLTQKVVSLEGAVGRQLGRADPQRKSPRGRHWQMPTRVPAGFRDEVTAALQAHGFTFRQARQAVKAFFESIKSALLRGEEVETPFGKLRWEDSPDQQKRWRPLPNRSGPLLMQVLFRNPTRIVIRD